jgi:periplasmic copper chaperone A
MKRRIAIFLALSFFLLTACAPAAPSVPQIEVLSPTIMREMAVDMGPTPTGDGMSMASMGGVNAAAFMTIKNSGGSADHLIKVQCSAAKSADLYQMVMKDSSMSMNAVNAINIPANGQVELNSGGYHVMLMGLGSDIKDGDKIQLRLTFDKAGTLSVDAVVHVP